MKKNMLRVVLPAGSLKASTLRLLEASGFKVSLPDRSYKLSIDDQELQCTFIRAQEIARYVEQGAFDLGITGFDWISESEAQVIELAELKYSKRGFNAIRLVLAVPSDSPIKTLRYLEGKRIATELVAVTTAFLKKNSISASVEFSWGATEAKPPYLVDAIAELVDSGQSLTVNNLRPIATILESTTRVISNAESLSNSWKNQKIIGLIDRLQKGLKSMQQ